jgi:hypothetical protein
MNAGHPIRYPVVFALAVILLALLVLAANQNAALRIERARLADTAVDQEKRLNAATLERARLRLEAGQLAARLAEATNSSSASLTAAQNEQKVLHDKLRAEITRLSSDNVLKDTQADALRAQLQSLGELQNKTDAAYKNTLAALAASSNEVTRITALDADKAARLAQREQDLAAKVNELAKANEATAQAAAAQAVAEKNALATQGRLDAAQAELAALKARVAEFEAEKARAAGPPAGAK